MGIIKFIEDNFSRLAPEPVWPYNHQGRGGLPDGSTVVVVGGGLAGSCFARQLLMLCKKENKRIKIFLVNSTGCNYCGGLVTSVALKTMKRLYNLDIPKNLVLEKVEGCIYVNSQGSVFIEIPEPLIATLRTSRFGVMGFDDSIKSRILEGLEDYSNYFTLIEPTVVRRIIPPKATSCGKWKVILSRRSPDGASMELIADLVVVATGFNSLNKPMLKRFSQCTGYTPPPVYQASVTEIDTSNALFNQVDRKVYMLDGIVPGTMLAFIPKGRNWLTLTALNKHLTFNDLELLFNHPAVKETIILPSPIESLRCHVICPAFIYTRRSKCFYGNGWVTIGDLSGYGRVLKDGYYSVFIGAWLAAHTVIYHGISEKDFARYYHKPLRNFEKENILGIRLFNFNNQIGKNLWFNQLLLETARSEKSKSSYGWAVHCAFRGLKTGLLSYWLIGFLFVTGILRFVFRHPLHTLKIILNNRKQKLR